LLDPITGLPRSLQRRPAYGRNSAGRSTSGLLFDEIRASLARGLPAYEIRTITRLGNGLADAIFEVNGELIVRQVQV